MTEPSSDQTGTAPDSRALVLFDRHAILIATLIGSLIAGSLLAWWNYRAMARPDLARRVLVMGIGVQALLLILTLLLVPPDSPLQLAPLIIQLGLAWFGIEMFQGAAIAWHLQRGARLQSIWRAAGFGFLTGMAILFVFVFVTAALAAAGLITLPEPPPAPPAS